MGQIWQVHFDDIERIQRLEKTHKKRRRVFFRHLLAVLLLSMEKLGRSRAFQKLFRGLSDKVYFPEWTCYKSNRKGKALFLLNCCL